MLLVGVYTEEHLSNPIAFRVFVHSRTNRIDEPFQLYNDDGTPNLRRVIFLPIVYMSIAFKIHDILIELDKKGELSSFNSKFLNGYIRFLSKEKKIELKNIEKIIFEINQLNIDEVVKSNAKLNKKMIPLLELKVISDFTFDIYPLKGKLLKHKSLRNNPKLR